MTGIPRFMTIANVLFILVLVAASDAFAAKPKPTKAGKKSDDAVEDSKPAKAAKKPVDAAGKIETQLQRSFKSWDRDKDESIDKEELEKFYAKLKVKSKKKPQGDAGNQPDPMAAVAALHAKMDSDQDEKVSRAEFDVWTAGFASYLSKYVEIQDQRVGIERELAELQALAQRSGNVTAADGIFQGEASRGIIRYQQMIKSLDKQIEELDMEGGHGEYRDFVLAQVLRGKRS